jgi:Protein of unknown function (DUF2950)
MRRMKLSFGNLLSGTLSKIAASGIILIAWLSLHAAAQQPGQKTFPSSEEASQALFTAAQHNDDNALLDILGPDAKEIVSSGDTIQDANNRANWAKRFEEMHRLKKEPDGTTTLYIGAMNWPSPIPLMHKNGVWFFDTPAGKNEILYRRIGENEISAIMVCEQLVEAQKEYYSEEHHEYAQKIFSDAGQHNGLYWEVGANEAPSPIGPLVAEAEAYGHGQETTTSPYRGYYFHILTGQGKNVPGGAKSYIVSGKMTGGFAFVAYPAGYRSSGVVTFIVDKQGVVYQKDLGKDTEAIGKMMTKYEPDPTWRRAKTALEESGTTKTAK